MAWTYLVESGESVSPWRPGCDRLPIVRSTPSLEQWSCPECGTGPCRSLLFGTTFEHCEQQPLDELTSSTEAFPVKTSALQELEKAWVASEVDFIEKSLGSSVSFNQASSSWRTSPQSDLTPGELSRIWPVSGLTVGGRLCPLPKSEPRTKEIDGGYLLPTPSASSYGTNQGGAAGRVGKVRPSLRTMFAKSLWPMPTAKGNYNKAGLSPTSGDGLVTALKRHGFKILTTHFLCWLMGYLPNWLNSEPSVMQSCLPKRAKRL